MLTCVRLGCNTDLYITVNEINVLLLTQLYVFNSNKYVQRYNEMVHVEQNDQDNSSAK